MYCNWFISIKVHLVNISNKLYALKTIQWQNEENIIIEKKQFADHLINEKRIGLLVSQSRFLVNHITAFQSRVN